MSIRVVKPSQLGLVHRTFEDGRRALLTITAFAFFPLDRRALLHEVPMWKLAAERLGDQPLDAGMPKARGELLVLGSAYAGGAAKPAVQVRVQVGEIDRRLYVFGDRRWETTGPTDPIPFSEMPLTWERAFGGEGFDKNPLGRGVREIEHLGARFQPLPNVEDPKHLVRSPGDKPDPAALRPLDQTWPQRARHVGTYDAKWQKTRFPWFPEDFNFEFFNVASEELRLRSFFAGDEAIRVEGMHPGRPTIEGRLPDVVARLFVAKKKDPLRLIEVANHLDTVILLPDVNRGVALFRGTTPVDEDDAGDVSHVVGAFDDPRERRPHEHFETVVKNREQRERAILYVLRDSDLLPSFAGKGKREDDHWSDVIDLVKPESLGLKYANRGVSHQVEEMKRRAAEIGEKLPDEAVDLDLEKHLPPSDPEALVEFYEDLMEQAELAKEMGEHAKAFAEEKLRADFARRGMDLDEARDEARKKGGGPPREARKETTLERLGQISSLRRTAGQPDLEIDRRLADPEFHRTLEETERQAYAAYRAGSHAMPDAPAIDAEAALLLRGRVEAALTSGEPLRGWDLTRANLAGMDLSGCDLGEALLECADLSGAKLVGAKLVDATLAKADLRGADLSGADLTRTNLGKSRLAGAVLDRATLKDTVLTWAELGGASMREVSITGNMLVMAQGGAIDFSGASFELCHVFELDLAKSKFVGAKIKLTAFVKCALEEADFSGADLLQSGFLEVNGKKARFDGAKMERVLFALKSDFSGATFVKLAGYMSSLRGCDFSSADFTDAALDECDLGDTNFQHAKLWRASMKKSYLAKADLRGADVRGADMREVIFQKALVSGTDLRGVNLFRADMAKVRGDDKTDLKDAYLVQVRTVPDEPAKERST